MTTTPDTGSDDGVSIVGARENNLKDVSLTIPRNRITVFTGVSGSGKSSLVFDTLAVESQRQLYATFNWFIRNQLPRYGRPHVTAVENLTAPVVVDQKPLGGNARSTVGTLTDLSSTLRVLFSHCAESALPPGAYSFNDPQGMCPQCEGLGQERQVDVERMLDRSKSLDEGAILLPTHKVGSMDWQQYANSGHFDTSKRLCDYTEQEWHTLLHGSGGTVTVRTANTTTTLAYEGVVARFARTNLKRDLSTLGERARANVERFVSLGPCTSCGGARLAPPTLASTIAGRTIADLSRMEVGELVPFLETITDPVGTQIAADLREGLSRVVAIGLGYLSLDRSSTSLSGGEAQRLKMVRHLSSSLTGMTYVFDEPSTGLHPQDVGRLSELMRALCDRGNTLVVVEHDPDVIALADHVVDLGPGAGPHGGEVVYTGPFGGLLEADTVTGRALRRRGTVKPEARRPTGKLSVEGADLNNLRNVSVAFPTGVLTAVTGVAGSGKSSLVTGAFRQAHPDAVFVDQSPVRASARSTPVSFLQAMDPLRKLFARATGAPAGLFSFNSAGACGTCQGRGEIVTELAYMDPVRLPCEGCGGRRFQEEVLRHRLRGRSVADVLEMTAQDALDFFTEPEITGRISRLVDVGLPYLTLGRSLSTLSGGERQRLKLAGQLERSHGVYVLDEPTTGLHRADVDGLVALLDRLVDRGNTVIVVEHDLEVVRRADWVVDLGPGGGRHGGEVVFTGTPAALLAAEGSVTGEHLRRFCAGG
ncbi:excinuclease ABC subunit UvrA [Streptomyces sp. H23]|uniref:ATP-binding cassette domain-containing protein n=1 Tax=Streptomyces sp. H23 TaxID=2541723 RepID=UPI00106E09A6|nr:excinuclease ABC subunit UvrA [Streptomyces sp. H23]